MAKINTEIKEKRQEMENIIIEKYSQYPSLLGLGIKGTYGNKKGTKSITFRKGMSITDTAKCLKKLADFIEEKV